MAVKNAANWHKLELVATAYNSVEAQTDSTPDIAAWGDKLKPGMKAIAVSRDLLDMGLTRGSRVWISGLGNDLEGEYVVLDKMNKRWKKRIDVYMGEDVKAALRFGKREVVLRYQHLAQPQSIVLADNR
ncbi:MAG: 3D domain-containing protein [Nevskiales bacterium]